MSPVSDDDYELMANNSWRPTLSIIGAAGLPLPEDAGNVLRPYNDAHAELPPAADRSTRTRTRRGANATLTTDVPYGAKVTLSRQEAGPRLERAGHRAVAADGAGRAEHRQCSTATSG